jgi:Ca2+-binding EF-hand superfamily protein
MEYRDMDQNDDARITREEWQAYFDNHDWNRDRVLSGDEMMSGARRWQDQSTFSEQFSQMDRTSDGVITYDEWSPGSRRSFEALDLNRDARLSRDEFYNEQQYVVSVFRELDQNNDGTVSRSEWRGTSDAFNRLDTNTNNFLSEDEFNTPQSESVAVQILQEIFKKR